MEPVVAMDGLTYEAGALKVWFLDKSTSPVTGEELPSKDTVRAHQGHGEGLWGAA